MNKTARRPLYDTEDPSDTGIPVRPAGICPPDAYSEAFESGGTPRAHWQAVIDSFNAAGIDALNQRQHRVRRMRHEDGATYNPFDDPGGQGTPWALDMIPMALPPGAWAGLETGLIQRARLLDRVLADIYGPQETIKNRLLPPALVYANPGFLRTCHGIQPAGDRYLTFYAADIYRTPDGRFRVLRDYGANPTGLGYALENRIVISRVLPDLYHQNRACRLAPFFNAFQRYLAQQAGGRRPEPGIVLLTPGPDSRIYFEHAFLSRYLGYPLVEGQDLTVRNGRVFLKKLAGLEPVEAIFRQTADTGSDPLCPETGNGHRCRRTHPGCQGALRRHREPHWQRFCRHAGPCGVSGTAVPSPVGRRSSSGQPPGLVVRHRRRPGPYLGRYRTIGHRARPGPGLVHLRR